MMVRFIVITSDRDGSGYHVQLRSRLAATIPDMQSRRLRSPKEARHEAQRLFGELRWQSAADVGLDNQPYVVAVAEVEIEPRR